jgi:dethiobiotin synthetase
MNFAHRLLFVSTESAAQDPPHPSFAPCYLRQVLVAYTQHYPQQHYRQDSGAVKADNPSRSALSIVSLKAGVDLAALWQQVNGSESNWVFIEAQESLGTPLYADTTVADLAWDWRLGTVLLVPLSPQSMSQTIAYTALARQTRCPLRGIIWVAHDQQAWNDRFDLEPSHELRPFTSVPFLGTLPPWNANASRAELAQLASDLKLEYFFPYNCSDYSDRSDPAA